VEGWTLRAGFGLRWPYYRFDRDIPAAQARLQTLSAPIPRAQDSARLAAGPTSGGHHAQAVRLRRPPLYRAWGSHGRG
jgi:hypothetical protein